MFAIVDIETTGGYAERNRIVEIAIVLHDGQKITAEWSSLVNPERNIPSTVTAIHGITDAMVSDAPRFFELAKEIWELLEGRIFVAHNVNFDYSFVRQEFESLGAKFSLKKLCTVRLARKIFPGHKSYSLGSICSDRRIPILDRHRALGDAKATAILLDQIIMADTDDIISSFLKRNSREATLPANLPKEEFVQLPERPGVYYFIDAKGKILYVGKAKNIKSRVTGHFSGDNTSFTQANFKSQIHHIQYEETGNELVALLLESFEIRKHWPPFNRAQKHVNPNIGLYTYEDSQGYQRWVLSRAMKGQQPFHSFYNLDEARQQVRELQQEFDLCPKYCGLQKGAGTCFDQRVGLCSGACDGRESSAFYNQKANKALESLKSTKESLLIIGRGRKIKEKALVWIEKGKFQGFGFVEESISIENPEQVVDHIRSYPDNQDIQKIIRSFMRKSIGYRVLKW